jgi:hypothetical protein
MELPPVCGEIGESPLSLVVVVVVIVVIVVILKFEFALTLIGDERYNGSRFN